MDANVYDIIFPLLRTALWGEEKFPFHCQQEVNWDTVNEELKAQTVHYLPVDILCRIDKANSQHYFQKAASALRSWFTLMQEQQQLYLLFQSEGIPFVILKGATADCYYPKPAYRCMGDIDLIVNPKDFARASKCMEENGYCLTEDTHPKHNEYKKNDVIFELHHQFSILKEASMDIWLDTLIYNAINHSEENSMETFSFPMLPTLENGLVLLTHINQHLENGLGLRQIIDWMLYVNKEMTDEFWNTQFCSATEKIGLKTLAITVTRMCQMYLGLTKELAFCHAADDTLCEELMQYIIEQGNFGRKQGSHRNKSINTLAITNIPTLFSTLQKRGLAAWKALEKYPFLKPFAWTYMIYKYAYMGFKREKPLKQLKEDYLESKTRDNLLNRLQVTRHAQIKE